MVEVLSERILCLVLLGPVERSLAVFLNAVKTALVNLHPEVAEKLLQFFYWIIGQILNIRWVASLSFNHIFFKENPTNE